MYRKNVCCFIFNECVQFLGCVRIDSAYLQCVQGGIEASDKDIVLTALREIKEEIGLNAADVRFVSEIPPPDNDPTRFRYELRPGANLRRFGYRGQEQRVLLFFMPSRGIEKVVVVPPKDQKAPQEFSRVEWVTMEALVRSCPPEKAHIFKAVAAVAPELARDFLNANKMNLEEGSRI